jgi:hypothetical protein
MSTIKLRDVKCTANTARRTTHDTAQQRTIHTTKITNNKRIQNGDTLTPDNKPTEIKRTTTYIMGCNIIRGIRKIA